MNYRIILSCSQGVNSCFPLSLVIHFLVTLLLARNFFNKNFYQEFSIKNFCMKDKNSGKKLNWEWCLILNCIFNFFPEDIMECLFVLIHEVRSVAIFLIYSVLQNFNSIQIYSTKDIFRWKMQISWVRYFLLTATPQFLCIRTIRWICGKGNTLMLLIILSRQSDP